MPKVTVILMHQLSCNRKYLDLAMEALNRSSFQDFEIRVMSGAETPIDWSDWPHSQVKKILHEDKTLDTATKKIGEAIRLSDSELVLLHSDDVFVSQGALGSMVHRAQPGLFIQNPFGNSGLGSDYACDLRVGKGDTERSLCPDMGYEEIVPYVDELIRWKDVFPILIPKQWVSFYCTLIPRKIWEVVGGLDPALENRHNDQDFCMRAAQFGISSAINLGAFAFHFGSKTLMHVTDEAEKLKATHHFMKKWGLQAPGAL